MPAPTPPALTDGIIPTGAGPGKITILETNIDYILDTISRDPKTTDVRRKTGNGRPLARKIIQEFMDGGGDIQIADESTPVPLGGMAFIADVDRDGTAEPYMVGACGDSETADGEIKSKMTFARFAAPCIYSATANRLTSDLYAGIAEVHAVLATPFTMLAALAPDLTLVAATWAATGLPAGMLIDATTGVVSGTPTTANTYYVSITVQATRKYVKAGALVTETLKGRREFVITVA